MKQRVSTGVVERLEPSVSTFWGVTAIPMLPRGPFLLPPFDVLPKLIPLFGTQYLAREAHFRVDEIPPHACSCRNGRWRPTSYMPAEHDLYAMGAIERRKGGKK